MRFEKKLNDQIRCDISDGGSSILVKTKICFCKVTVDMLCFMCVFAMDVWVVR